MKKNLLFFLLILSTFNFQPSAAQKLVFEQSQHDFGKVEHSLARIEHRFEFTNGGSEPLVVTRAQTSCNCVRVEYPRRPVAPGARGEITVIYEVNKKEPGVFYKVVEIYSNSTPKRNNLIIKGNAVK